MKNWFQRQWARLFTEHRPLNAAPAAAPEWTEEHAQFLRNFLSHPLGQDLLARARALETKLALDACHKRNGNRQNAPPDSRMASTGLESLVFNFSADSSASWNPTLDKRRTLRKSLCIRQQRIKKWTQTQQDKPQSRKRQNSNLRGWKRN